MGHGNRKSKAERSQCSYNSLPNVGTKILLGRTGVAHKYMTETRMVSTVSLHRKRDLDGHLVGDD